MIDKLLAADIVGALSELRTLGQDGSNPHFKSRYLTLQTLIEGVRPILARHNLALLQPVTADGASVTVTTTLLHNTGTEFSSALTLTATGPATPQALGSLISYGRRYGAGSLLGIVSDPDADDDGNAASTQSHTPVVTPPDGFLDWLDDLVSVSDTGQASLKKVWAESSKKHRAHLTAHHAEQWESIKSHAATVKVGEAT